MATKLGTQPDLMLALRTVATFWGPKVKGKAVVTTAIRHRCDTRSTRLRLLIKGHWVHSELTR